MFCTKWHGLNKGTASLDAIDDRELDHQSILEIIRKSIVFLTTKKKKNF